MVIDTQPILPLDIQEATWLVSYPSKISSTTELIGLRAMALAKHVQHVEAMRSKAHKEKMTRAAKLIQEKQIKDWDFKPERLVLVRNSAIEALVKRLFVLGVFLFSFYIEVPQLLSK